eukprot:GFYU01001356.1.p1 GENE.GFYU01001356.1~~GFYU01001356.1.p1  ORF type:complete len:386 (+),score=43.02 GFYU01001356.1:136-1293(+)
MFAGIFTDYVDQTEYRRMMVYLLGQRCTQSGRSSLQVALRGKAGHGNLISNLPMSDAIGALKWTDEEDKENVRQTHLYLKPGHIPLWNQAGGRELWHCMDAVIPGHVSRGIVPQVVYCINGIARRYGGDYFDLLVSSMEDFMTSLMASLDADTLGPVVIACTHQDEDGVLSEDGLRDILMESTSFAPKLAARGQLIVVGTSAVTGQGVQMVRDIIRKRNKELVTTELLKEAKKAASALGRVRGHGQPSENACDDSHELKTCPDGNGDTFANSVVSHYDQLTPQKQQLVYDRAGSHSSTVLAVTAEHTSTKGPVDTVGSPTSPLLESHIYQYRVAALTASLILNARMELRGHEKAQPAQMVSRKITRRCGLPLWTRRGPFSLCERE